MAAIELKDIIISARQESHRMQHFYIGVEHLFIALLEIRGGLARRIIEAQGLTPEYVTDAIRRKIGKGSRRRTWAGTPSTPRCTHILQMAQALATADRRAEINERDLFMAIVAEDDNMPTRVLRSLGLNLRGLLEQASGVALRSTIEQPFVHIEFASGFDQSVALSDEHLLVLRRMFYGYAVIRVESHLAGGYSHALLLVVTPINADGREDAPVVVKIDHTEDILDEAQRYDQHIKTTLPPMTARIEDKPVAPEICTVAGIKYTMVAPPRRAPQDLRTAYHEMGVDRLGPWIAEQVYDIFGPTWWHQRRPVRFQVWTEYDWLLPPLLTVQLIEGPPPPGAHTLRVPVNRSKLGQIECGDVVILENFTIHRIDKERGHILLANGRGNEATRRAYKIEVNGVDFSGDTLYYRGEVIEQFVARVWKTRAEAIQSAAALLDPPFDLRASYLAIDGLPPLPNPIIHYDALLNYHLNATISKQHGDLHLGNILIGPNDSAFLVDFANSRDGHTLFDWAVLEISLLKDIIMPAVGDAWHDAYEALDAIAALSAGEEYPPQFAPLAVTRSIIAQLLTTPDRWAEYQIALLFCILRALTWDNDSLGSRRLLLLLAGLALEELSHQAPPNDADVHPSDQEADITEFTI